MDTNERAKGLGTCLGVDDKREAVERSGQILSLIQAAFGGEQARRSLLHVGRDCSMIRKRRERESRITSI